MLKNYYDEFRDADGFSNPGGLAVIGLTELPNSGWAKADPAHPLFSGITENILGWSKYFLTIPKSEVLNFAF